MDQVGASSQAIVQQEEIGPAKAAGEFVFLGLRMTEGVSMDAFRARFGRTPSDTFPQINDWIEGDFMKEENGFLRLTPRGLLVANSIFVQFM
jgi:oxygen-independent coproporphyrinogen-3 oxidase